MFSLERELIHLRDTAALDEATAAKLIAVERRDIVNLYGELRFLTWAAVMLIVTGVGVLVSKNLDRLGPATVAVGIAAAAAACYAWAFWKRRREPSLADDYILLLGALLVSADAGYVEHTWHLLGDHWKAYLLALAIVHAATAYLFDSRLVLSVALTSLAAWFGIRRDLDTLFDGTPEIAVRGLICAATVLAWRFGDAAWRERRTFAAVFEHFATNLAFTSAIVMISCDDARWTGAVLALTFAGVSAAFGMRAREEIFVIYAWIYGLIAVNVLLDETLDPVLATFFGIFSSIFAVAGLFIIHSRMTAATPTRTHATEVMP